jgi:Lrp/AsnC family leucine-responsive transcriptional regulator
MFRFSIIDALHWSKSDIIHKLKNIIESFRGWVYVKPVMLKLVSELFRNSRKSDREMARKLGVSQPTVSRMRGKLESEGIIKEYTIIPDFAKLGFELVAISCVKAKVRTDYLERAQEWVKNYPNIVLSAKAEGSGKNAVMISLHKSYTDYSKFVSETQMQWADDIENYDTILIALKGPVVRAFSLRSLAEAIQP